MSAVRHLSPGQFGSLRAGDEGYPSGPAAGIEEIADTLYAREPHYMTALQRHVTRHGVQDPVQTLSIAGNETIWEGHHRAAAAHRAGVSLPVTDAPGAHDYRVPTDAEADRARYWDNVRRRHPEEQLARERFGEEA